VVKKMRLLLTILYLLDRLLKLFAIAHFFRRPAPPAPAEWPSVTVLSPLTAARHDLRGPLVARARLAYAGPQQHLLICDRDDMASQEIVREVQSAHPNWNSTLLLAEPDNGTIASKVAKLQAALPQSSGEVLVFVDDDVTLRPDALQVLLPYLNQPQAGAAFGLACYTAWQNTPSSLISAFVNANALPSYVPLSYLCEPYTITGHCFALRRNVFAAIGGIAGLEGRIDDDHELARRLRIRGLRCLQTPLIYEVENVLPSFPAANAQLKRWFVFPRETMLPFLTRRERFATAIGSLGSLLPPLVVVGDPWGLSGTGRANEQTGRKGFLTLLTLVAFAGSYAVYEGYLGRRTPWQRWPLLLVIALLNPLHIIGLLAGNSVIEWRGQRLRILPGGRWEPLGSTWNRTHP
jgi:ceramide glucosyltransferase